MSKRKTRRPPFPTDAGPLVRLLDKLLPDTPETRIQNDEIDVDLRIGQVVYDARVQSGLTQAQLAKVVRTTQSAICRIEDPDYRGHTLKMLVRIAHALGKVVQLKLVPKEEEPAAAVPAKRKR